MAHVRAHHNAGHPVKAHNRGTWTRKQNAADAGMGVLVTTAGVTTAVLDLTAAVVTITMFALMAVFGAMLGVRFYRRRPRGRISKFFRPPKRTASKSKPGKPARRQSNAPWAGHAPFGSGHPSTIYKRQADNSWR